MSHQANDHAWEAFWTDKNTADRMMLVGQWAESFPGKFDVAWFDFYYEILKPNAVSFVNAWKMDAERQEIFIDYLTKDDSYGFNSWLDERFKEAMEPGWDTHDSE